MKKLRNLKELDQRIQALKEEETKDKELLSTGISKARKATEQIELAFYIGRIASDIFKAWKKPGSKSKGPWKNIIISLVIIAAIHFAQEYLEKNHQDEDDLGEDFL